LGIKNAPKCAPKKITIKKPKISIKSVVQIIVKNQKKPRKLSVKYKQNRPKNHIEPPKPRNRKNTPRNAPNRPKKSQKSKPKNPPFPPPHNTAQIGRIGGFCRGRRGRAENSADAL